MAEIREKPPEWEPIEDYPPGPTRLERVLPPILLAQGILGILFAITDAAYFHLIKDGVEHISVGLASAALVLLWAVHKMEML